MIPYEAILKGETNDSRFEAFCRKLLQASENITLVSTSYNYDRGRDGVSIRPATGTHAEVVCCTLERNIDSKVVADAKRLSESKTSAGHFYYCTSLDLTEHRIDQLTADFKQALNRNVSITFLTAKKLADIAERFPELFRDFYHAEVRSVEAALQAFQTKNSTETRGLRLALLAFASDDAQELRRNITTRAILDALVIKSGCSSGALAEKLSADLGLPTKLGDAYINSILQSTTLQGLTTQDVYGCWCLTPKGIEEAASVPPEAAQEVVLGKGIVREALQRLIGKRISDLQYDAIWSTLLDFFSEYFYTSGFEIITAVNNFLSGGSQAEGKRVSLEKLIEAGAQKARLIIATEELGEQVEQAIKDVFTERSGPAFDWLSRLCERFVALCALGLEGKSSDEIRTVLIRNRVVLDTDIVLTLLCECEEEHDAARDLITNFRRAGGRIVLSTVVLEEVAYHAWIAERELWESEPLFGRLSPEDSRRFLNNTFVRAFFKLGWDGAAKLEQWKMYIDGFRGSSPYDFSKLLRRLQTELAAERLPELVDDSLRKEVTDSLKQATARHKKVSIHELGLDDAGKAETDGKLMGSISACRDNLRQVGSPDTLVLLTSSGRLRWIAHQFKSRFGSPNAVISPAALSYLIALLPGTELGINTLRRALFEFRDSGRLADTERLALKVLKSSGLYDVPWAARVTLEEQLNNVLEKEAQKLGVGVKVVRDRFIAGDKSVDPAKVIIDAITNMAISDKKQAELEAAHRRISELEEQLDEFTHRAKKRAKN